MMLFRFSLRQLLFKVALYSFAVTHHHLLLFLSVICSDGSSGGGGDFVAGFLLGGAVFGTVAYIFAPQVIRFLAF
jgi:hypothetical protein